MSNLIYFLIFLTLITLGVSIKALYTFKRLSKAEVLNGHISIRQYGFGNGTNDKYFEISNHTNKYAKFHIGLVTEDGNAPGHMKVSIAPFNTAKTIQGDDIRTLSILFSNRMGERLDNE